MHQGIAVYGNKGSTDQHAYVQQLREGVHNFFVTFIEVLQDRDGKSMALEADGATAGDYLAGFLLGTRAALYENDRESITLTIDRVDARTVGMLIALYERAVGFYASLVGINAYHQPGVEAGKKAAGAVLALQQKILALLADNKGKRLTVDEVAREDRRAATTSSTSSRSSSTPPPIPTTACHSHRRCHAVRRDLRESMMDDAKQKIGLIGLAVMGENLALNIEEKGFPIAVYNRTIEKVVRVRAGERGQEDQGHHVAEGARGVARAAAAHHHDGQGGQARRRHHRRASSRSSSRATCSSTAATSSSRTPSGAPRSSRPTGSTTSAWASRAAKRARATVRR